jgi:APA family basic amino acid/polyamine antiporter
MLGAMSDSDSTQGSPSPAAPKRQLTLFDSTCIIVGIIIGAGIYETTPLIAQNVSGAEALIGVWLLGGLLSLIGAMCYAELATAYPKSGGDYVYLTRGFGRPIGFLFAWAQLWVVRPGSIGAMAYVFGRYANELWPLSRLLADWYQARCTWIEDVEKLQAASATFGESIALMTYAALSVVVLTGINIIGVREGKWTQNLLTVTKVLGLTAIVVVGFCFGSPDASRGLGKAAAANSSFGLAEFGLAMIFVLFTYGGWNEMAYVGAEVRNPRKNILRALILGTVAVALIYAIVNLAFVFAVGLEGTRQFGVATDVLRLGLGDWAGVAISILISISALGAINGNIFTGARIYYAMGTEHQLYAKLGRWSPRLGTPVWSLLVQALVAVVLIIGFGMTANGFQGMVLFTTPVFWFFLVLVGLSVFVLRYREPGTERPYRVPGYPITPVIFCLSSSYMVYASLSYAIQNRSWEAIWSIGILAVGVLLCFYDPRPKQPQELQGEAD